MMLVIIFEQGFVFYLSVMLVADPSLRVITGLPENC